MASLAYLVLALDNPAPSVHSWSRSDHVHFPVAFQDPRPHEVVPTLCCFPRVHPMGRFISVLCLPAVPLRREEVLWVLRRPTTDSAWFVLLWSPRSRLHSAPLSLWYPSIFLLLLTCSVGFLEGLFSFLEAGSVPAKLLQGAINFSAQPH